MSERMTDGTKWTPAPFQSAPANTGSIQGVWLAPNQEVEWIWTHGMNGSYVSGYSIRTKPIVVPEHFGDEEKSDEQKT